MNTKILTAVVVSSLISGAAAFANSHGGGQMAQFVGEWDMNGNGVVEADDIRTRRGDIFYMFDQNGDDAIAGEELEIMAETIAAGQEANHGGEGQGNGHGGNGPGQYLHPAMTLEFADTDGDGAISAAEWEDATERLVGQLDSNGDGVINPADFGH